LTTVTGACPGGRVGVVVVGEGLGDGAGGNDAEQFVVLHHG